MKRVVIVGASFAGLRAYAYLEKYGPKNISITLIDKQPVATYIPSLHLVLGDPKYMHSIQLATKKYYSGFVCDTVEEVTKTGVRTSKGFYEYDYLILANGAPTNFFGNESFEKHTLPAKTPQEVRTINERLRDAKHIAVVGGGLTGVEYAAMLAVRTNKHISLVTATERLVPQLPEAASKITERFFRRKKTQLYLAAKAQRADEDALYLSDGRSIKADLIIWCAGIKQGSSFLTEELEKQGNIFLAGDVRKSLQAPTAHNAMICGEAIAKSIIGKMDDRHVPVHLHNWETLALALGPSFGALIIKNKWVLPLPFIGLMKWFIERRIMYEWKTKKLLYI